MVDTYGEVIVEGPYYCQTCKSGDNLVVDDDNPNVSVVYCLVCDNIVHLHEV